MSESALAHVPKGKVEDAHNLLSALGGVDEFGPVRFLGFSATI
jgi:hypothetical protein